MNRFILFEYGKRVSLSPAENNPILETKQLDKKYNE